MKKFVGDKFEKYGVLIMALALISTIIALPILAHAECDREDWGKARHSESLDKRKQALHDELKLSDAQEAAWHDYLEKSKPSGQHPEFDKSELSSLPTPERLDRMLLIMKARQEYMESHVQAVKSFYAQLTPEQQKIFDDSYGYHRGVHEKH